MSIVFAKLHFLRKEFSSLLTRLCITSSSVSLIKQFPQEWFYFLFFSPLWNPSITVKVLNRPPPSPKQRMNGAISVFRLYAFMAWTMTTFLLFVLFETEMCKKNVTGLVVLYTIWELASLCVLSVLLKMTQVDIFLCL